MVHWWLTTIVLSRKIDDSGEGGVGFKGAICCTRLCIFTGFVYPFTLDTRRPEILDGAERMRLLLFSKCVT